MYDANTSQKFNATSKTVVFTGGKTGQQYKGSDLDAYLNETFFATLSATMQAAIVPKAINQDMWEYGSSAPSSGTYYHLTYASGSYYYYDSNYGTAEVGSRNVYVLSIRDALDYLSVEANGDFVNTDIGQMFWNKSTANGGIPWLRSAYASNNAGVYGVSGNDGIFNTQHYRNSNRVRPAFQIDLSKIAYTKN